MTSEHFDIIVIGAGTGGLSAATFARQLGARVALIERHRIGGDCTWTGCVPSKALIRAARAAHEQRHAARFGIGAVEPQVDMPAVRAAIRASIETIYAHETPAALTKQGITVVQGAARFVDPHTVQVGARRLHARRLVIASGARPTIPAIAGLNETPYLTYEQIFDNETLPRRMVVIGGGPIGCEIAQAYARLGARVTIVAERLLVREDYQAAQVVRAALARDGVIHLAAHASRVRPDGRGGAVVTVGTSELPADLLLVAVGRTPNTDDMDLDRAGVRASADGITIDARGRTSAPHIAAVGDCTGGEQFTHYAGWQAVQAVRSLLIPGPVVATSTLVPRVTFTDPELAHVGLTEAQARAQHGAAVRVAHYPMTRNDRAIVEDDAGGFIKAVYHRNGRILGVSIVHARAGDGIGEWVLAMRKGLAIAEISDAIHPYPTYSISAMQLAGDVAIGNALGGLTGWLLRRIIGRG